MYTVAARRCTPDANAKTDVDWHDTALTALHESHAELRLECAVYAVGAATDIAVSQTCGPLNWLLHTVLHTSATVTWNASDTFVHQLTIHQNPKVQLRIASGFNAWIVALIIV